MSASELMTSSLWWQGPAFLQLPKEKWPMHEAIELSEAIDSEMIKTPQLISHVLVTNLATKTTLHLEKIMELKKFSTLNKMLRVIVFVFGLSTKGRQAGRRAGGQAGGRADRQAGRHSFCFI